MLCDKFNIIVLILKHLYVNTLVSLVNRVFVVSLHSIREHKIPRQYWCEYEECKVGSIVTAAVDTWHFQNVRSADEVYCFHEERPVTYFDGKNE